METMTAQERVLKVYPDAEMYVNVGDFSIGSPKLGKTVSAGQRTREAAWEDAASKLPTVLAGGEGATCKHEDVDWISRTGGKCRTCGDIVFRDEAPVAAPEPAKAPATNYSYLYPQLPHLRDELEKMWHGAKDEHRAWLYRDSLRSVMELMRLSAQSAPQESAGEAWKRSQKALAERFMEQCRYFNKEATLTRSPSSREWSTDRADMYQRISEEILSRPTPYAPPTPKEPNRG
jgi:hypothetical protein